jgi:hypothetical protein
LVRGGASAATIAKGFRSALSLIATSFRVLQRRNVAMLAALCIAHKQKMPEIHAIARKSGIQMLQCSAV